MPGTAVAASAIPPSRSSGSVISPLHASAQRCAWGRRERGSGAGDGVRTRDIQLGNQPGPAATSTQMEWAFESTLYRLSLLETQGKRAQRRVRIMPVQSALARSRLM